MGTLKTLGTYVRLRGLVKTLDRIATAQEAQLVLLTRLADWFAPPDLPPPPEQLLRQTTGASYNRDSEIVRIEAMRTQLTQRLKREPTDEELLQELDGVESGLG